MRKQILVNTDEKERPKMFKRVLKKQKDRKIACDLGAQQITLQFQRICNTICPMIKSLTPNCWSQYKDNICDYVKREV